MELTIKKAGMEYEVSWPWLGLIAHVDYINERSYRGQVAISHMGRNIHRSKLTMDDAWEIERFESRCEKMLPGSTAGFDWPTIMENLTGAVIDKIRTGDPVVILGEVESKPVEFRVNNILVEDEINVLWGDSGVGKSMFGLWLGTLISENYTDTSHGLTVEPGTVLYCDYEPSDTRMADRTVQIHAVLGLTSKSKMRYRSMTQSLETDYQALAKIIDQDKIDFLIIDSLGLSIDGDLSSMESTKAFFNALKALKQTSLVITHSNKAEEMYGSKFIRAYGRNIWSANQFSGSFNAGNVDFSLVHTKANDIPEQPVQSWEMKFNNDQVIYTRKDPYDTGAAGLLTYNELVYKTLSRYDGEAVSREHLERFIAEAKNGRDKPKEIKENTDQTISDLLIRKLIAGDDHYLWLPTPETVTQEAL